MRLSDREHYLFRPTVVGTEPVSGGCTGDVQYERVDGTTAGAELLILGNTTVRATAIPPVHAGGFPAPSDLIDITTGELYQPESVRLRLRDGRVFDLTTDRGIVRIEDRNGNQLFINPDSIVHDTGRGIALSRDPAGRIERIADEMGRAVE